MNSALQQALANVEAWKQKFSPKNKIDLSGFVNQLFNKPKIISPLPDSQPVTLVKAAQASKPVAAYEEVLHNIKKGFNNYGNPPIASKAAQLAQLGVEVAQKGGNPYLPAALTLKETGGLRYGPAQEINNPVGIGPGIRYPNLDVAILGGGNSGVNGGPQKGLKGVLFNGLYNDYYKTGNLQDFFKHYTPEEAHNNPSYQDQIELMQTLLDLFE